MKYLLLTTFLISWTIPTLAQVPVKVDTVIVDTVKPGQTEAIKIDTVQVSTVQVDTIKAVKKDTTYWKRSGQTGINLNQGSFSNNWTGGGVNSIALGLLLNAKADYLRDRFNWTSEIQFQYGIVKNEGQGMRKNVDRLFVDSKAGYRISKSWQLFGSGSLLSQFAPGYKYENLTGGGERIVLISGFFAPAYITEAIGLEYKPNSFFNLQLSPATLRQTILSNDDVSVGEPKRYGVPEGRRVRNEAAFQALVNYDRDVAKNLNLKARYLLFANYATFYAIDHRLDFSLTAKINRFVNVNFTGIILYDKDQDNAVQYSQGLAIGLLYKF